MKPGVAAMYESSVGVVPRLGKGKVEKGGEGMGKRKRAHEI